MKKLLLCTLATALLIPSFAKPSAACDPKCRLVTAAEEAGIPIYTEELIVLTHGEDSLAAAPIQGFEKIPASAFAGGVDMAYAYINFPESSSIPSGTYLLRGRAAESDIHEGEYGGTVDLVNADGGVVASLPARIHTFSTTVPDPLPYPRTVLTGAWKTVGDIEPPPMGAKKAKPIFLSPTTSGLFIYPDWISTRGWPVRYVFVRVLCSNGSFIDVVVAVSP